MPPLHFSQRKAALLAIGVVFLLLFPTVFGVIFPAKDELSYSAGVAYSTCDAFYADTDSDLSRCTTSYNITLGNTGSNDMDLIYLELAPVPQERRLSWNVLDIVATNRRAAGPAISTQQKGEIVIIEIRNLQANRLVEFTISAQGLESMQGIRDIEAVLRAEGSILEVNPRATVSLRFLRSLGAVFGF